MHIILDNFEDYFDLTGMRLRKATDEVIENMHQCTDKTLTKSYKVKHLFNPKHGLKLFHAICHVNAYNLKMKEGDFIDSIYLFIYAILYPINFYYIIF